MTTLEYDSATDPTPPGASSKVEWSGFPWWLVGIGLVIAFPFYKVLTDPTWEEGFLFITGRLKRIAKVVGLRVNLDEVEQMLKTYGPAAAVGENDRLRIFCEFGDEKELDRLTEEMSNRLAIHRSALRFERVEQLPLNANGKIDYAELKR